MLARINGGNSGIREYLENGLKQGREFGRDDLDNRIILDGNIDHLENTINSIEDKGQERYMHITLSFAENEISKETLQAVTEEYKNLLMNAYHTDEYCFYAEAHLPKIKNITDEKTGELIERKPHIHIVIPRTNLVTQKSLNPRGDVTKSNSIKLMDSIQEHINNKYNLISPKDSIRVSDNNHANVLSRYKGDFFKGRETNIKKEIFNDLDSKNIRTEKDFLDNLSRYGEVKTYNKGKENQYHAVKLPDNDKFTRLKSPLFSEQYITKRELPLVKPTPKEIEKNLTQWLEKTSHEIKHIYPSSQKNRDVYKALSDDQKAQVLNQIKDKYNDRYNLTDDRNQERDRTLSARGLIERGFKVSREQPNARLTPERLPSLQERHMVYELQGFRGQQTKQSDTVLLASNSRDMAEVRQTRQHDSSSMRWTQDNTRGINSNLKQEQKEITHKPDNNDLQVMKEIRTKINPDRFLAFCADKYKINPNDHVVTFAKDGSPRFNAGKTNLNASDFLTKHLKIDWKEAKENLIEVYNGQLNNTKFNKNTNISKTDERSANRTDNLIKKMHYQELKQINREYQRDLFKINRIKNTDKREVERGFAMFNYLKASEKLNTITAAKQIVANEIRATTPKEDRNMAEIYNADRDVSFTKSMEKKKVLQQYQSDIDKGVKLTDLVCSKKEKEITYTDKKTQKEVFTDKGSHLHVPDTQGKEKIALALEYAEKKFGGKLQLSGSEQFKMTAAITAAEKGMNIILTPDKYHQMMLDHVEKMKQPAQQEQAAISKTMTAEQKAPEQADAQAKPDTDKLKTAVEQTPDPVTPSQLKQAVEQVEKPEQQKAPEQVDAQAKPDTDKLKAAVEQIPDPVSPSQLKQAVEQVEKPEQQKAPEQVDAQAKPDTDKLKAAVEQIPDPVSPSQLKQAVEQVEKPEQQKVPEQNVKHTVDGKDFDKLIVVPVQKDDGYEKSVSFNMAFKQDDKIVSELKNVKESDLQRMGIDTKGIDMRSVQPVNIQTHNLKSSTIETPLKHAEKKLNEFKNSVKNKEFSHDEFKAMKAERAKLEDNVAQAKKHVEPETNKQTNNNKKEQDKGMSM